jgi:hypothetical protein
LCVGISHEQVCGYCATCISCKVPLPRDLADLKARIIAAVKNIDALMLTRVWQKLEYRIDVCRVTVVHTSNISSCQKKKNFFSFPVAVNNSIKVGPLVFLLQMFLITENIMKRPVYCNCQKWNSRCNIDDKFCGYLYKLWELIVRLPVILGVQSHFLFS